jgi:AraC-like DNA-binding protein
MKGEGLGLTAGKRGLSIADVALAVGFSDASQLNRVFRKLVGVTPTAFRRENGLGLFVELRIGKLPVCPGLPPSEPTACLTLRREQRGSAPKSPAVEYRNSLPSA